MDISPDLLDRIRKLADEEGVSFKEALSRVITRGLAAPAAATVPLLDLPTFPVGFSSYFDVDKVGKLISRLEDERNLRSMGLLDGTSEDS